MSDILKIFFLVILYAGAAFLLIKGIAWCIELNAINRMYKAYIFHQQLKLLHNLYRSIALDTVYDWLPLHTEYVIATSYKPIKLSWWYTKEQINKLLKPIHDHMICFMVIPGYDSGPLANLTREQLLEVKDIVKRYYKDSLI